MDGFCNEPPACECITSSHYNICAYLRLSAVEMKKINRGWTQMHADTLRVGTFGLLVFVVGIITSLKLLRVPLLYLITIIDGGELNV